jgi:PTH1 family peptidyl-tRNA hydrolase
MKLLVGLGNPGSQYAATRHNIGFMVLDRIAELFPVRRLRSDKVVHLGQTSIDRHQILLIKPQTYMNLSGIAVQEVMQRYHEPPASVVVIYDDLDLNVGQLRIRRRGGHGGHKGVQSVMDHLETQAFIRLRMGIGRPDPATFPQQMSMRERVVEYVLQPFCQEEQPVMAEAITRAVEAIKLIVTDQLETAMNRYNRG